MTVSPRESHYVKLTNRKQLSSEDLSPDQLKSLSNLNKYLSEIELNIKREVKTLTKIAYLRVLNPNDWVEDYMVKAKIYFILNDSDPAYEEEGYDNILAELTESFYLNSKFEFGVGDIENHNEFQYNNNHPLCNEYHCWIYHCLYDHTDLGWVNILRIGKIWLDFNIQYNISSDYLHKKHILTSYDIL